MAYLIVGGTRSYCSCDRLRTSVDPTASGHYVEYSNNPYAEPCGEEWEYHVTTYRGMGAFSRAVVPYKEGIG